MWTVLRTLKCWEGYQQATSQQLGIVGMPIAWGSGPKEYPCLISTYMPSVTPGQPPKLVSAYVYRSDAEALLASFGVVVTKNAETLTPPPTQDNFNRWVSSYLLALVRELREIGALKAVMFEQSLMEALQLVDEVATERKDEILNKLDKADRAIIDRLLPP